jgi:hypothetical protein
LLGCVEPLPMSLGTKLLLLLCLLQMTPFGFSLAFGHLGEFSSSLLCLCVGVDNALIKGEIANTLSICV